MRYDFMNTTAEEDEVEIQRLEDVEDSLREQIADQLRDLAGRDLRISGLRAENNEWHVKYATLQTMYGSKIDELAQLNGKLKDVEETARYRAVTLDEKIVEWQEVRKELVNAKDTLRILKDKNEKLREINREPYDEGFKDGQINMRFVADLVTRDELDDQLKAVDASYQTRIETLEKYLTERTKQLAVLEARLKNETRMHSSTATRTSALFTQGEQLKAEVTKYREYATGISKERDSLQEELNTRTDEREYWMTQGTAWKNKVEKTQSERDKAQAQCSRLNRELDDAKSTDADVNAVLSTFLEVLEEWINGAIENHIDLGHRDCMDSCANEFHIEDIRRMVEDTRRQLAVKAPEPKLAHEWTVDTGKASATYVHNVMPTVQVYAERDALRARVERLVAERNGYKAALLQIEEIAVDAV